jgi:hypothetical protein
MRTHHHLYAIRLCRILHVLVKVESVHERGGGPISHILDSMDAAGAPVKDKVRNVVDEARGHIRIDMRIVKVDSRSPVMLDKVSGWALAIEASR